MKLSQLPVKILLALIWMMLGTESVRSQSANMSDISLPNPESMIPDPEVVDEPVAGEVDPEVVDEPVAGEVDPEVVDEPVAGEVDPEVVDEPVAGEVDPEVVDEPVAGEVDPEVVDEPVAGEVDPEVVDESVVGEVDPEVVDEPVVGEVDPEVVDESVVGEVDPEVVDEPVAGEVDPEVVDESVVGEVDPEVVDEPVVGEVDPEVVDEPVVGEVDPEVVDEPVVGEVDPEVVDEPVAGEVDPEVVDEPVAGEVDPEVVDEPVAGEVDPEVVDEPVVGEVDPDVAELAVEEIDNADELNAAGDVIEETLGVVEAPTSTSNRATRNARQKPSERNDDSATAFEDDSSADAAQENEVETIDSANSEPSTTESEVVEGEPSNLEQESPIEAEAEIQEETAEPNEIVEELIEEAEVRAAQKVQAEEKEVAQEEIVEEEVAQEETVEEEVAQEEEEVAEEQSSEAEIGQLDRVAYETQFQEAPNDLAILMQEEFQLTQLMDSSGIELYGSVPSVKEISRRLAELAEQTGKKPAFINVSLQSNQLESFVVMPEQVVANADGSLVASSELNNIDAPASETMTLRKTVKDTSRKDLIATATEFREEISDVRKLGDSNYKASAQKLYDAIIRPIEAELEANDIDILVFSMDSGLRLLPVAALHDGEQFLVEKYAMGMVPSFGLTDTRYVSPEEGSILAMGASEFEDQAALPTMPLELQTIVSNPRRGESFLNEQFTIPNFVAQNSREAPFSIIHLGTHAEFKAGDLGDSYIQFYDDKLKIPQLQQLSEELGWNSDATTPIELLVLSACETALGDNESELGFAGLAVQAGVKSALASLWYVSDLGTLALMGEFYDQLGTTLVKAEALRQTQLEMLNGSVMVEDRQVKLSNGADLALSEDFPEGSLNLDHPYFWSSFTLIGNWN